MSDEVQRIKVIDSHTAGEPTRVVVEGLPEFAGSPEAWRDFLRANHDGLRTAVACEPRGHEAMVGAYLFPPTQADCVAGVGRQACDTSCAAPSCDAATRFFVSLRCQVMIVVTGRLAIKRNAREASFQGVGRRRAVARARGPTRARSRGRHQVF